MKALLAAVLTLLTSSGLSANTSTQNAQAIRTLGFIACNNLLVSYNPYQDAKLKDSAQVERYRTDIASMGSLIRSVENPKLETTYAEFVALVKNVEDKGSGNPQRYAALINPVLEKHAQLDKEASFSYGSGPPLSTNQLKLDELTLDIQRLLLLYETRVFGSLAVYFTEVECRSGCDQVF